MSAADGGALPALQNHWLGVLTGVHDPPSEPGATCGDCVMCADVQRSGSRLRFSPEVKCCSYLPHLANFLVGRSLRGPGRESVLQRMARRSGVTPLGVGLGHADAQRLAGTQHLFGRSVELRCPHYLADTHSCAIWQTRNAVCSTWFCKHERGAVSQRFWHAVRDLLMAAEERLAYRCLTSGRLPPEQVSAVLEHRAAVRETIRRAAAGEPPDEDPDDVSPEWYDRMWGAYAGREEEWFATSADLVEAMDDDGLRSWMAGVQPLVDGVGVTWAELREEGLPERLEFRPAAGSEADADVLRLIGYSPFDPLVEPAALLGSLRRLDGRPTVDVLAEIEREHAVPLPRDLLTRLHDHGVAVAVAPEQ